MNAGAIERGSPEVDGIRKGARLGEWMQVPGSRDHPAAGSGDGGEQLFRGAAGELGVVLGAEDQRRDVEPAERAAHVEVEREAEPLAQETERHAPDAMPHERHHVLVAGGVEHPAARRREPASGSQRMAARTIGCSTHRARRPPGGDETRANPLETTSPRKRAG